MKTAYLDCFAGISGDMLLGALHGAGVPLAVLESAAGSLGLGVTLHAATVDRSGIASVKIDVLEHSKLADGGPAPESSVHAHSHAHGEAHSHAHAEAHSHTHTAHSHETHWHGQAEAGHAHTAAAAHAHQHTHGRSLTVIRELIAGSRLPRGLSGEPRRPSSSWAGPRPRSTTFRSTKSTFTRWARLTPLLTS